MNHHSQRERQYRRQQEIPEPILDISQSNVIVSRCINEFVAGHIITKEECLCQMVKRLAQDWTELQKRAYENYSQLMSMDLIRPNNTDKLPTKLP